MAGTQGPTTISTKQARIATLAKQRPQTSLNNIAHHIDIDWLREAYRRTRKSGAAGIDGVTAEEYEHNLEDNLRDLLERAKSGTYRAPPVRRVYIPKGNGKSRPIGIPTLEDKILQRAVVMVLQPLYEQDFYDFSYGFRPGRSPHQATQALREGTMWVGSGWVLDVDIQSFFDDIDRQKLRALLRRRVTDGVIGRLIGKWLRAGVMEDGRVQRTATGTPQGGVVSPLLANVYLHEVLDRWWVEEVLPRLSGRACLVRFADDFVMVFRERTDAERVLAALPQRFGRFGLTLHPEKTRLVDFRRPSRRDDDAGKPGTFDFLGFSHYWGRNRGGRWVPKTQTSKQRLSRSLVKVNDWLKRHRHAHVSVHCAHLNRILRGHYQYYGTTGNSRQIASFYHWTRRLWKKWLSRRSQKARLDWEKFKRIVRRNPLLPPRIPKRSRQLRMALS